MNPIDQTDWLSLPEIPDQECPKCADSRRLRRLGYAIGAGIVLVLVAMAAGVVWWVHS